MIGLWGTRSKIALWLYAYTQACARVCVCMHTHMRLTHRNLLAHVGVYTLELALPINSYSFATKSGLSGWFPHCWEMRLRIHWGTFPCSLWHRLRQFPRNLEVISELIQGPSSPSPLPSLLSKPMGRMVQSRLFTALHPKLFKKQN